MTNASTPIDATSAKRSSIFKQPLAVWAIAFAATISFMGIGLVDPILPAISRELGATPGQTMWLFTSYLLITGIAMFFTSWVSGRVGVRKTLVFGLILIILFAALAGASSTVGEVIGFRAGWGLGNALFISTALAAIVGVASGGTRQAIVLYEAALGVGLAIGPLVGGALGAISWRGPFFGTAALMAIALVAILAMLREPKLSEQQQAEARRNRPSSVAGFKALRNRSLLVLALVALFYNLGFFVLLAYTPYPMEAAALAGGTEEFGAHQLGFVFFGWGLALAITSVFVAPVLTRRFGLRPVLFVMLGGLAICLVLLGVFVNSLTGLVVVVIAAGLLLGVMNTALTEAVMEATDLPRNVASSTYSGVRFIGGAIAPAIAGTLAEGFGAPAPYWVGAGSLVVSILLLVIFGRALSHIGAVSTQADAGAVAGAGQGTESDETAVSGDLEADAISVGDR